MYWADKVVNLYTEAEDQPENVYSLRATTTAMRNNLHKSQALRHVRPRLACLRPQLRRGEGARPGDVCLLQSASQLIAGCHLPQLYSKLEYILTNNTHLAEKFFRWALAVALNDAFILHELGMTAFSSGLYKRAEKLLSDTLLRVESVSRSGLSSSPSDKKERLLNNLGHTHRKLGRYQESISFHQQALVLSP